MTNAFHLRKSFLWDIQLMQLILACFNFTKWLATYISIVLILSVILHISLSRDIIESSSRGIAVMSQISSWSSLSLSLLAMSFYLTNSIQTSLPMFHSYILMASRASGTLILSWSYKINLPLPWLLIYDDLMEGSLDDHLSYRTLLASLDHLCYGLPSPA